MTRTKKNLVANIISNFYQPLLFLIVVPSYIKIMGDEAFGLVGLFVLLQMLSWQLDFGLSLTLNRELAKFSDIPDKYSQMRNLLRTFETLYWIAAIAIGLLIAAAAEPIANYWLKPETMSVQTITRVLIIMSVAIALQWPMTLYMGGLMGLQRQVLLGVVNIVFATIRFAGVIPLLGMAGSSVSSIEMFFYWQAGAGFAQTVTLGLCLWFSLPRAKGRAVFSWHLFRDVWRFASGVWIASILAVVVLQLDKIVMSRTRLDVYGAYSLASIAAMAFMRIFGSFFAVYYPRFSQLVHARDDDKLKSSYHGASQMLSVMTFPIAMVVMFFSADLMFAWTGNAETVRNCSGILAVLTGAICFMGLMHLPFAMQLAYGWTRLTIWGEFTEAVILAPLVYFGVAIYGGIGAACALLAVVACFTAVYVPLMHRKILKGQYLTWCIQDVLIPIFPAAAVCALAKYLMPVEMSRTVTAVSLAGLVIISMLASAMATPSVRKLIVQKLSPRRN